MGKRTILKIIQGALTLLIYFYQGTFSILLGPCCRFYPSCSCYAVQAVERFGIAEGCRLTLGRIIKCHPLHPGGYDPVPETQKYK